MLALGSSDIGRLQDSMREHRQEVVGKSVPITMYGQDLGSGEVCDVSLDADGVVRCPLTKISPTSSGTSTWYRELQQRR